METYMPKPDEKKDSNAERALEIDDTTTLDIENKTQAENESTFIKPEYTMDPMTTNVTIKASRIKHLTGVMTLVTTTAGQIIVPVVSFVNEKQPAEVSPNEDDEPADTSVTVTAAYARSQGII